jgi:hypothetical protein
MSTIIVRNVAGTGPFARPASDAALDAATTAWQAILEALPSFDYTGGFAMLGNQPSTSEELMLMVENFMYNGAICPGTQTIVDQLRALIQGVLNANPNITSFGTIDINMWRQGTFYEQAPRVARVDRQAGTVFFEDRIPPGAQIEVYKFCRHKQAPDHTTGTYPPRLGHRYRQDRMLAKGQTTWTVPDELINIWDRQHFKFAYRWPAAPGTPAPAPGVRGPLSPVGISTGSRGERHHGVKILLVPSPRHPLNTD